MKKVEDICKINENVVTRRFLFVRERKLENK